VFGYIAPVDKAGISKSKDGRELYMDASVASWFTPEEAWTQLTEWKSYTPGVKSAATQQVKGNASSGVLQGVSSLRWHGLTDEQIDELYAASREAGIKQWVTSLNDRVHRALKELEAGNNTWDNRAAYNDWTELMPLAEFELQQKFDHSEYEKLRDIMKKQEMRSA